MNYPNTRIVDQIDNYHGISVADPYRWLEDAESDEAKAWIDAQNVVTFGWLHAVPERAALLDRLTKLWDYEKYGLPYQRGGRYFYTRNDGLQNQSVLYVADALEAEPRVLIDPNRLSAEGTVALAGTSINEDGSLLAYAVSDAGSDWQEWRVRDVATGVDLSDHLQWVKSSGASWTKDGKGFFYSRYQEPAPGEALQALNQVKRIYYHRLGESQSQDTLIYERPDQKEWYIGAGVTEDGRYLLLYIAQGTSRKNRIFYKDLAPAGVESPDAAQLNCLENPVVEWLADADAAYSVIDNDGPVFYVKTDRDAPRSRVVAIDIRQDDPANWRELVPEAVETLQSVSLFGDEFICTYLKDAHTQVKVFGVDGSLVREVALPGIGTAGGFGGRRSDKETFFFYTGYTTPTAVYRYDVVSGESTLFRSPKVDFDPAAFTTEQVFYTSKDGVTRVPMFLTCKNGMKRDGTNPTLLYGYGGFNISLTPSFSPSMLAWMELGGVYAVPNLRGGGEYGEEWHEAGTKLKKQNVFDDFIAAAEWLIANGVTSPARLAISGGSNGGLLVGACLNQRPDLYGAALPSVGVMDMLRFDKFTVGWGWKSDYGSPDDPAEFAALYAYSPLHNIKPGTRYPATLIRTGDHDDRVVPAHSFKYAAALQAAQAPDGPPMMIRIETRAGHGAGKPTTKSIEESADMLAFLIEALGVR